MATEIGNRFGELNGFRRGYMDGIQVHITNIVRGT